jgi:hypothetical protein
MEPSGYIHILPYIGELAGSQDVPLASCVIGERISTEEVMDIMVSLVLMADCALGDEGDCASAGTIRQSVIRPVGTNTREYRIIGLIFYLRFIGEEILLSGSIGRFNLSGKTCNNEESVWIDAIQ